MKKKSLISLVSFHLSGHRSLSLVTFVYFLLTQKYHLIVHNIFASVNETNTAVMIGASS